jgi:hypothetical protein
MLSIIGTAAASLFAGGGIMSALGQIFVAVIAGMFQLISTLASSAAGRWFLAACMLLAVFCWQRHYYIGMGRDAEAAFRQQIVQTETAKLRASCQAARKR